jgi:toxic protein SymE
MNTQEQFPTHNTSAKPRMLKVGYKPLKAPGVEVPFLSLRGRWMRDAGFDIGRNVKVEIAEGRLIIERID